MFRTFKSNQTIANLIRHCYILAKYVSSSSRNLGKNNLLLSKNCSKSQNKQRIGGVFLHKGDGTRIETDDLLRQTQKLNFSKVLNNCERQLKIPGRLVFKLVFCKPERASIPQNNQFRSSTISNDISKTNVSLKLDKLKKCEQSSHNSVKIKPPTQQAQHLDTSPKVINLRISFKFGSGENKVEVVNVPGFKCSEVDGVVVCTSSGTSAIPRTKEKQEGHTADENTREKKFGRDSQTEFVCKEKAEIMNGRITSFEDQSILCCKSVGKTSKEQIPCTIVKETIDLSTNTNSNKKP